MSPTLIEAAQKVDILGTATRVLDNPDREAVATTKAECLALAWAVAAFWQVCIEAEQLVDALAMPTFGDPEQADLRDRLIKTQEGAIARLMAAIRGETPEGEEDGHHAG